MKIFKFNEADVSDWIDEPEYSRIARGVEVEDDI